MKVIERQPCQTCPYRRDVPVGVWHPEEFEKLRANDSQPLGAMYGCHKYSKKPVEEQSFCAGWLIDQRNRNMPALQLRLRVMRDKEFAEDVQAVTDGGLELYESINEMCLENGC